MKFTLKISQWALVWFTGLTVVVAVALAVLATWG
jgi:hypothetical protein